MSIVDRLNVRLATRGDAEQIVSFSAAMAFETEGRRLDLDRLSEGTRTLLESPDRGFFMVAELEEGGNRQLLGQLMITYEWSDWRNGSFWWIQSLYVDPAWRRQNVFRRMHEAVMARAKTSPNVCGVRLYVEESNSLAQAVYRRVGLTPAAYAIFETDFVLARHKGLEDRPHEA
ncbi:MAG: GNAT family N-acetyltransferase [Nitrospirota bacterium]|nr:GNAT family N-acetyltransferase [Nitrospirota bacterium]MDP2384153.1 GNAT family N-acetyltransferase [Nitrospirota bacterium]MDP3597232.1 GNAT family N-acetyltransferase [Nitrospirota bacterium]